MRTVHHFDRSTDMMKGEHMMPRTGPGTLLTVTAVLLAGTLLLPSQGAAAPPKHRQRVEGTVILPANGTDPAGCDVKPARRMWSAAGINEVTGYVFEIDPKTWGKRFRLRPAATPFSDVDLDLTVYYDFPTREEALNDPVHGGSVSYEHFERRKPGGEHGPMRPGAVVAIVCIYGGMSATGVAVPFVYTAG